MPPTRPMDDPRRISLSVDARGCAERRLGMLFAEEAARGEGGAWGAAACNQGHRTAAEVVACMETVLCQRLWGISRM